MDSTGLGLLPGLGLATGLMLMIMAALLMDSMWAVACVLVVVLVSLGALVFVVVAVSADGDEGGRLRRFVPGLDERESTEPPQEAGR
ncbi:MAG: hypothetical protein JW895_07230 [Thermoleophilaceae bacterium]|nr:hypothetical protein [Thermoleophilaceae bacterium]